MLVIGLFFSAGLGIFSFFMGFLEVGLEKWENWVLIFGVCWLFGTWKHWRWFPLLSLFATVALAIWGAIRGLPMTWMAAGASSGLLYWDLWSFEIQISSLPKREDIGGLIRRHFLRLTIITFAVLLIMTLLTSMQAGISKQWYYLLAFIFILGVVQIISLLLHRR